MKRPGRHTLRLTAASAAIAAVLLCLSYLFNSLPYSFGGTKRLPDETFEDFDGIFALWCYEYTDEYKEKLRREFLERSKG